MDPVIKYPMMWVGTIISLKIIGSLLYNVNTETGKFFGTIIAAGGDAVLIIGCFVWLICLVLAGAGTGEMT